MHQNAHWCRIRDVEKDLNKLFQGLGSPRVPAELYDSVLLRIDNEARRVACLRLAVFVPLVFVSALATVVSFQYLAREIAQSGLLQYLSIIFSDGSTMLTYWKEFSLSIAEEAPVFEMAIFLGTVVALVGSLKATIKNVQTTFTHIQLV